MPVDSQHQQYKDNIDKWTLLRDCDQGASKIKAGKTKYLPMPNPEDESTENQSRYKAYLTRANFVNFVGHTKEGMTGMIFRKETNIELDPALEYMKDNINGDGLTADQMIKDVTDDNLLIGRYGLLADYPPAPSGLTKAQVEGSGLMATIKPYPAESIKNWRTITVGAVTKLSMVVLCEPTEVVSDDGFEVEVKDYHRVLLLKDFDGKLIYVQNLYDENNNLLGSKIGETEEGDPIVDPDIIPKKSDGSTWNIIPFQFIGAVNNDSSVDKSPIYDIAEINIAHYRNSADYEESCFMVGQPTPYMAGLSQSWVESNFKDGVMLGSRGFLPLPEGGSAGLVQADPNQMPQKGMEIKEQQMIRIGARLIQDVGGVETAEAAKIRFAGQNSKVGTIINNVESAFKRAFEWAGMFMGASKEPEVKINKELYDKTLDPQMVMAQIALLDRGVIAKPDLQDNLRSGGLIRSDRTNEEIDAESESSDIMTGGIGAE